MRDSREFRRTGIPGGLWNSDCEIPTGPSTGAPNRCGVYQKFAIFNQYLRNTDTDTEYRGISKYRYRIQNRHEKNTNENTEYRYRLQIPIPTRPSSTLITRGLYLQNWNTDLPIFFRYFFFVFFGIRYFSVFGIPTSVSVSVFWNTSVFGIGIGYRPRTIVSTRRVDLDLNHRIGHRFTSWRPVLTDDG